MDVTLFDDTPLLGGAGFAPNKVSGLLAWYAARLETGFNDGDDVTTFTDQSGRGNHITQTNASRKPHYRITTRNIGGKPALEYVPANFQFHSAAFSDGTWDSPFTLFVVCRPDRSQTFETVLDDHNTINNFRLLRENNTGNNWQFTDTGLTSAGGEYIAEDQLITAVVGSSANSLRKNGVEIDTSTTTVSASADGIIVGGRFDLFAGSMFDGLIAEVILYEVKLNATEINLVETFLMDTYDI